MNITIIGAGNMGRAIATRAVAGRHQVRVVDHNPAKAAELASELDENPDNDVKAGDTSAINHADVVVLALKYPATVELAAEYRDALAGKVVIDIANPADFTTFDPITAPDTSAAEEVAAALPDAYVVKAFNTTFAAPLIEGHVDDQPLDVLVAGDNDSAKATVTDLLVSARLHPIDVGPLRRARALETFQIMHMSLQQARTNPWHSAIFIAG
ncbi:NADPH-dependent F420 reductase [Gordonia bronchialis]|uniref:NADPH-dependent F420 reductase n=1 Tax=Gordonia bronchialis TaxID=2054 RepID=UPI00226EBB3F|nr:NAD(P)-binding domain-containing protein [Gordonia bronchialis]